MQLQKTKSIIASFIRPHLYTFKFSSDKWKERDDAAEKVYISSAESTYSNIQKILSKNYYEKSNKMMLKL